MLQINDSRWRDLDASRRASHKDFEIWRGTATTPPPQDLCRTDMIQGQEKLTFANPGDDTAANKDYAHLVLLDLLSDARNKRRWNWRCKRENF